MKHQYQLWLKCKCGNEYCTQKPMILEKCVNDIDPNRFCDVLADCWWCNDSFSAQVLKNKVD